MAEHSVTTTEIPLWGRISTEPLPSLHDLGVLGAMPMLPISTWPLNLMPKRKAETGISCFKHLTLSVQKGRDAAHIPLVGTAHLVH